MTKPRSTTLAALGGFEDVPPTEQLARARAFFETMRRRRTIRDFSAEPVDRAVVETCIATAGRAPSGANHQPWRFVLVGDPAIKKKIRAAAEEEERAFYAGRAPQEWLDALAPLGTDPDKPFLEIAPWLIVVFAQKRGGPEAGQDLKNYYVPESVGIACGFLLAALHHAGLATLTHTPSPMGFLLELLDRPPTEKAAMLIVVGKPAPDATVPLHALKKKALADILTVL